MNLEYLNSNSTINYPFHEVASLGTTLKKDWLVDFQFVDTAGLVTRVYLKQIVGNTGTSQVSFVIGNAANTNTLITVVVPFAQVVSHIGNATYSSVSASSGTYKVKLVFGEGILATKVAFTLNLTQALAEFSPSTVVSIIKRVDSIEFINNYPSASIHTYTAGQTVPILPGHNIFMEEADGALDLQVIAREGTGLYNPCEPDGDIEDVLSIFNVEPREDGSFSIGADNCYSVKMLSNEDLITYGSALDPYINFELPVNSEDPDPEIYNAVQIGHTFLLTNNCKPKCPPENMNAFAMYLNRLVDGLQELYKDYNSPEQTKGTADTLATSTTLVADTFTSTYTGESGFIEYFHEGRLIDIVYSPVNRQTVQVVRVLNTTSVQVTPALSTTASNIDFEVQDLGTYHVLNNAILEFNTQASEYNIPYGKVLTSSGEGFNELNQFGTFISVVVAIFNPTINEIDFDVFFNLSDDAEFVAGMLKLRYDGQVLYDTSSGTLGCKEYATVENVFFVPCGGNVGTVSVETTREWPEAEIPNVVSGPLPGGDKIISIESAPCNVDTIDSDTVFCEPGVPMGYIYPGVSGSTITFSPSTLPTWASTDVDVPPATYNVFGTPTESVNTSYACQGTVIDPSNVISYFNLIIKVIVTPVITSGDFSGPINEFMSYQITATNNPTSYSASGLPTGLSVNTTTGIISGIPTAGGSSTVTVGATNASGTGSDDKDFDITSGAPVITSPLTKTMAQGLGGSYQITASNFPTAFSATSLPTGLSVNTTSGLIYGIPTGYGVTNVSIGASNTSGSDSDTLVLTVTQSAPIVTSATSVYATQDSSFSYQITAINGPTSYNATSMPTGLSVNTSSGLVSGTPIGTGMFTMTVSATNAAGTSNQNVDINILTAPTP